MSGGKLMYTVKFGDIAATNNTTLYSKPMGGINWAWGHNLYGSIGNNSVIYQSTPVSIQGQRKTICKVDGGNNNFNFIDNRGQVWGWGYGTNGGLGTCFYTWCKKNFLSNICRC
jgi:alpha-tubulin suppressor-like RCC1 family protein